MVASVVAVADEHRRPDLRRTAEEGVVVVVDPAPAELVAAQRPPVTQSNSPVKWSASRSRNSSGEGTPSLANAKIVFFWVSVATTWELSPFVCAASKSPRSCEVTLRSATSWRAVSRTTRTTRFSALPYWLAARMTSVMG